MTMHKDTPAAGTPFPGAAPQDPHFADMIEHLRQLQEAVAIARPPAGVAADVAMRLAALSASLALYAVPEEARIAGRRWDLPGRGQAFVPPLLVDDSSEHKQVGRVTFGETHLGAGGVVHGGVIPLVFVEILGLFANSPGKPVSRMAYLKTDFRAPIRVGQTVGFEARLQRAEGRKIFMAGRISDGEVDLAVAEALFVTPHAGV